MRNLLMIMFVVTLILLPTSCAQATHYWIAPSGLGGSDSNSGVSRKAPWLTPNHSVRCGDIITAIASQSYLASSFSYTWGTVSCPDRNNIAWIKCATFARCRINSSGVNAMAITASYWGVQGWELTTKARGTEVAACIAVTPPASSSTPIHHIVIANMVCNGAAGGGINTYNNGRAGIDYLAVVGNAIYDAVRSGLSCYSGISLSGMEAVDAQIATHVYVAGNIAWDNIEPSRCYGGLPTDGEGIILDTWSGFETGLSRPYAAQAVVEDNLLIRNGGRGLTIYRNSSSPVYVRYNTIADNNQQSVQAPNPYCSEFYINLTNSVKASGNLIDATVKTGCGGNYPVHAIGVVYGSSTDDVSSSLVYAASASPMAINGSGTFTFGLRNLVTQKPLFDSVADPGAPNCGGASDVPSCMAKTIAHFTRTDDTNGKFGSRPPSLDRIYDPLFPQWLCNVNLPGGLVTFGCSSAPLRTPPLGTHKTL